MIISTLWSQFPAIFEGVIKWIFIFPLPFDNIVILPLLAILYLLVWWYPSWFVQSGKIWVPCTTNTFSTKWDLVEQSNPPSCGWCCKMVKIWLDLVYKMTGLGLQKDCFFGFTLLTGRKPQSHGWRSCACLLFQLFHPSSTQIIDYTPSSPFISFLPLVPHLPSFLTGLFVPYV